MNDKSQKIKIACMICCPICDEKKCVGRFNCQEIKKYLEKLNERI
jgi:hypothetical protein